VFRELLTKIWWTYDPTESGFSQAYHWLNLLEAVAWCLIAAWIVGRYARRRRSPLELAYAASFLTFAWSDFREAETLDTWLILFKGVNLVVILSLRRAVLRRFYPETRAF
jgi:hypothetical protein